jgi:signal transduction histidine kinase
MVALAYYGGVHLGMAFTFATEPVSTLWPPNAILLTTLLFTPVRTWWAVLLAVLPAHMVSEMELGVPNSMSVCWYLSNSAEAFLGAGLLRHYLGRLPRLDSVRDVATLILVAGILAPAATSFLDAGFVALVGWRYSAYWPIWEARTLSNSLAALTVVPLALACGPGAIRILRATRRAHLLETGVLLIGLSVASATVFLQTHETGHSLLALYAPVPFLIWAAVRRGASVVAQCIGILSLFAIVGVLQGDGPFAEQSPEHAARSLETFLITGEASLMLLAAALAELRETRAVALSRLERLNLALESAKMGTWDWDRTQDRLSWTAFSAHSESTLARSGSLPPRELLNRIHVDDRVLLISAFARFDDSECEAEFRMRDPNGKIAWVQVRGRALTDCQGKRHRMIGIYSDVTRRKSREAQLVMQREQIARLNRALLVGALSGSLAHELLQPLTAVRNNAAAVRVLLNRARPDLHTIKDALADIIHGNERMIKIVRQMRALLERRELACQRSDVNECIEGVMMLERSFLIAHEVTADLRLADGLPTVAIDAILLEQVLINLVVNACESMQQNPAVDRHIEVVSRSHQDGVEIVISDSGTGIGDTEQIFEPFFTTKDNGIGLGLPICRMILSTHGGSLWAVNNPARGASLHLTMPAASDFSPTPIPLARRE